MFGRLLLGICMVVVFSHGACAAEAEHRWQIWVNLIAGEPVEYGEMLDDLAKVQVVYLGERHTLARHHAMQKQILADLAKRDVPVALALEQMESIHQPALDRYVRGEIDFGQLAEATGWAKRWHGYEAYRPVLETAKAAKAPIVALNARAETIRQVARGGGVAKLPADIRKELPGEMDLDDPSYYRLLNLQMMVHMAATPERLRPMIEAQIARDEAMAAALAQFLKSPAGKGRAVVVLCGAGHVAYGLGTPARVRRLMPEIDDRIVLLSESGDVELSPEERQMARPITITQQQLRAVGRPAGDYLHAVSPRRDNGSP